MERLLSLQHVESEPELTLKDDPAPTEWPQQGSIVFDSVQMRYRPGCPLVLKGLSFELKAAERVGICGRTGAGKSSVLAALLRLVEIEAGLAIILYSASKWVNSWYIGSICIDGVDISKLGVSTIRSRISMIPQDPVLFSGYRCLVLFT